MTTVLHEDKDEWVLDTGASISCVGQGDRDRVVEFLRGPSTRITTSGGVVSGTYAIIDTPIGTVRGVFIESCRSRVLASCDLRQKGGRLMMTKRGVSVAAPRGALVVVPLRSGVPVISQEMMDKSRTSRVKTGGERQNCEEVVQIEISKDDSGSEAADVMPIRDLQDELEREESARLVVHATHGPHGVTDESLAARIASGPSAPARRVVRSETPTKPGQVLVADVMGPEIRAVDGERYLVVIRDMFSGVTMGEAINSKEPALVMGAVLSLHGAMVGGRPGELVPDDLRSALHTDHGTEFVSESAQVMLVRAGGQHYLSTAYRHSGRAEAAVKYMRKQIREGLTRCGLSPCHWAHVARWVSVKNGQDCAITADLPWFVKNSKLGQLAVAKLKSPLAARSKVEPQKRVVVVLSRDRGTAESVRVGYRITGESDLRYTSVSMRDIAYFEDGRLAFESKVKDLEVIVSPVPSFEADDPVDDEDDESGDEWDKLFASADKEIK